MGGIDCITITRHPKNVPYSRNYNTFNTVVEVCETSGINVSVLCSVNIGTPIKELNKYNSIVTSETYKEGTYFGLRFNEITLVDDKAEDICLSIMFLFT